MIMLKDNPHEWPSSCTNDNSTINGIPVSSGGGGSMGSDVPPSPLKTNKHY